jgi:hypothetical protein
MQPCNRSYYSTVHWRLNTFWASHRSSSGALIIVFAAAGLYTHVVTGHSQVWVGTGQFPLRLDYGRSSHGYINQRLQIQLELLMMSSVPLESCWVFNERWNNKFYYKVASCWLFLLSHTAMHGSMNIKRYKSYLHILLPLLFKSCHSIISSLSLSMWIHSKFNYASELSLTFFDPCFQQGVGVYR